MLNIIYQSIYISYELYFYVATDQDEIHRLCVSKNVDDRLKAAEIFIKEFFLRSDKSVLLKDLHNLTNDENTCVRKEAAFDLGYLFKYIPEEYKSEAWGDFYRLTNDKDYYVRRMAEFVFYFVFKHVPEEHISVAWNYLHRQISNEELDIKISAIYSLGSSFQKILNGHKSEAWEDLHKLTNDEYPNVRRALAIAIGLAFQHIPEEYKSEAWKDLHRLTSDEYAGARMSTAESLGSAFKYIPEEHKYETLEDLHRLTSDIESSVRIGVANAFGSIFKDITENDKLFVCDDFKRLLCDSNFFVKTTAEYSLGKIYIYKASKSADEIEARNYLEEAIQCFGKVANEKLVVSSRKFCYLFYCSFDAILFKTVNSKKEIEDYISEAKKEIWGSESKQKLIEAIEQLAKALEIAYAAHEKGINWQEELKRCSEICDHVEQLMEENKEKTPAIHDLYKIAKPSFDKTIKGLIEAADVACKEAKGTPAEAVVYPVKKEIQRWCVEDQIKIETKIDRLYSILKIKVPDIPENRIIIDKINDIKNTKVVEEQLEIITLLIMSLPNTSFPKMMDDLKENMNNRFDKIDESQHRMELSLEQIHQKLDQNLDKLYTLSLDFKTHGKEVESEYIDTFENEIKTLIAERDSETLDIFVEKLVQNQSLLLDENDKSSASDKEKKEGEKSIFELKDLPRKIKEKMISATTEVSKEVVVSLIASLILESIFPILGPAAKEVVKILVSAIKSRENIINSTKMA